MQFTDIEREKLAVLAGDRRKARRMSAVRRQDLSSLANYKMKSRRGSGSVTREEHNALVDDMNAIINGLSGFKS